MAKRSLAKSRTARPARHKAGVNVEDTQAEIEEPPEEALPVEDEDADEGEGGAFEATQKKAAIESSSDSVGDYLRAIGKIPLLTAEQEVELSKRIEAGLYAEYLLETGAWSVKATQAELEELAADGRWAKNRFMEANLRLVVSIARRYSSMRNHMNLQDLIQEGNLGLNRAIEKFNYKTGYKFSTYAIWWIRQNITRGIADQDRTIRLPAHIVESVNTLNRVLANFMRLHGREPSDEELVDEIDISEEKVGKLRRLRREPVSLSVPIGESEEQELGDSIEDGDALAPAEYAESRLLEANLEDVLAAVLNLRELTMIQLRNGLIGGRVHTLGEIGEIYGITRERVRQIINGAYIKIRNCEQSASLRGYLR